MFCEREMDLDMDCEDEPLSAIQILVASDKKTQFSNQMNLLQKLASFGYFSINQHSSSVTFRTSEKSSKLNESTIVPVSNLENPKIPIKPNKGKVVLSEAKHFVRSTTTPYIPSKRKEISGISAKVSQSVSIVPRASKTIPNAGKRRSELDAKVKMLLVHSPPKFTEWLFQQGLLLSTQFEKLTDGSLVKLKLGMCSDAKKFPFSGGYVWINEGKKTKFISVFRDSIFESSHYSPLIILKLIYHWSCQTNTSNIINWVKVDIGVINHYFTQFRALTVIAVQDEVVNLGGKDYVVQIGVISLGTTNEGSKKDVCVEILGVLDCTSGKIRLRASEPFFGASKTERFSRILEPLPLWIQKDSKIITDFSVNKERLLALGFTSVIQNSSKGLSTDEQSNLLIINYLKSNIPKIFQNNLTLLTLNQIQQVLDELSFREINNHPLFCFDSLLNKLSSVTSGNYGDMTGCIHPGGVIQYLKNVSENPFQDWRFHNKSSLSGIDALPQSLRLIETSTPNSSSSFKRPFLDYDNPLSTEENLNKKIKFPVDYIELQSYYYGIMEGDAQILASEFKSDMAFKCHICKKLYMNNIEFMKHLCLHIPSERQFSVDLSDLSQCLYCTKDFTSPLSLETHLRLTHESVKVLFCRICEISFNVKNHFIAHMSKHTKWELPYSCSLCGFRSSSQPDVINHFTETHDRTDKLLCPLCLQIFSLFGDKSLISQISISSSYLSHHQTHLWSSSKAFSCSKCRLSFLSAEQCKNHAIKDHVSFKNSLDVVPSSLRSNEDSFLTLKPKESGNCSAPPSFKKSDSIRYFPQMVFTTQNLEDLLLYNVDYTDVCGECNRKIQSVGHYVAYLCCTKCHYSTCCSKAMSSHVSIFHGEKEPFYNLGRPSLLANPLYCVCGFHSNSGNKLAKHLAFHRCTSAYSSKESAMAAIKIKQNVFLPSVSDKDTPEKKQYEEDHGGPLAFLGLQRKTEEPENKYNQLSTH